MRKRKYRTQEFFPRKINIPQYIIDYINYTSKPDRQLAKKTIAQNRAVMIAFNTHLFNCTKFIELHKDNWEAVKEKGYAFFVNHEILADYFTLLFHKNKSVNSRKATRRVLKDFYQYAQHKKLAYFRPDWRNIFIRKTMKEQLAKAKPELTQSDIDTIRTALQSRSSSTPRQRLVMYRDLALLECIATLGCRVQELVLIKVEDINFEEGRVKITAPKTVQHRFKHRQMFLLKSTAEVVDQYIRYFKQTKKTSRMKYLFPTLDKLNGDTPLNENSVFAQVVRKWSVLSGIQDISPHRFRHYLISRLCEEKNQYGQNIFSIEQISVLVGATPQTIQTHYYKPSIEGIMKTAHSAHIEL